jgi:hypothetical protein
MPKITALLFSTLHIRANIAQVDVLMLQFLRNEMCGQCFSNQSNLLFLFTGLYTGEVRYSKCRAAALQFMVNRKFGVRLLPDIVFLIDARL